MTDKQKILAEIERLRKIFQLKYQQLEADDKMCLVVCGKRNLCNDLISFINFTTHPFPMRPHFFLLFLMNRYKMFFIYKYVFRDFFYISIAQKF